MVAELRQVISQELLLLSSQPRTLLTPGIVRQAVAGVQLFLGSVLAALVGSAARGCDCKDRRFRREMVRPQHEVCVLQAKPCAGPPAKRSGRFANYPAGRDRPCTATATEAAEPESATGKKRGNRCQWPASCRLTCWTLVWPAKCCGRQPVARWSATGCHRASSVITLNSLKTRCCYLVLPIALRLNDSSHIFGIES